MKLKELDSFKMSDAITFHDKLNPKLFRGQHLQPDVDRQLKLIAEDFLEELGIKNLDVKDITISGSNAAYSYTPHSDLDLHILVDMNQYPSDEIYQELFQAKKTIYNDTHDITVHGIPVELYVQDSNLPVVSLGEYSILNNKWLRLPTKRRSNFDQNSTKHKYEKLAKLAELAIKSKSLSKVKNVLDTIKRYRQAGLDKGGEFGPENLAYKALRSQGHITKLYDLRDKLHSKQLSLNGMYSNVNENGSSLSFDIRGKLDGFLNEIDRVVRGNVTFKEDGDMVNAIWNGKVIATFNKTNAEVDILWEGASGYIPSNSQKNDPRFKTALTVDIKPDTMKKNAKAFGSKTSRAGIPPTANPNGKIR